MLRELLKTAVADFTLPRRIKLFLQTGYAKGAAAAWAYHKFAHEQVLYELRILLTLDKAQRAHPRSGKHLTE